MVTCVESFMAKSPNVRRSVSQKRVGSRRLYLATFGLAWFSCLHAHSATPHAFDAQASSPRPPRRPSITNAELYMEPPFLHPKQAYLGTAFFAKRKITRYGVLSMTAVKPSFVIFSFP